MIFDTHAHYDDAQFDADREEVLGALAAGGIGTVVNVSSSFASCYRSVELARTHPFVYAAVGIHPDEVGALSPSAYRELTRLYGEPGVVAVGEIGLDYYWDKESHALQQEWFIRQLQEAEKRNLPVIIHSREAAADTLAIIRRYGRNVSGVMHCFPYSVEQAREYVQMGYYLGIGGVVTFKNGRKLKAVVADTPLSALVLETDAPYLAPEPFRGRRNSSLNLPQVAAQIAMIKQLDVAEVIAATTANARRLYRLGGEA